MNGASTPNGIQPRSSHSQGEVWSDEQVLRALEIVNGARSSNEQRQEASQFLENHKEQQEAPYRGFIYSSNKQNTDHLRYYGLLLLENAIRHRWLDYTGEQSLAVREWVLQLAQGINKTDAPFIRNKVAQLWVEIAKREWALSWMDMDEMLISLWSGNAIRKVLVLEILENLSENSFSKEDLTTAFRGQDLGKACVEIFTSARVMLEHFPARDTSVNVRHGTDGWLIRIAEFLMLARKHGLQEHDIALCAAKALSTLRSVISWTMLPAVADSDCVQAICGVMLLDNRSIQLGAIEALYALYSRHNFSDEDVRALVCPLYGSEMIEQLRAIYSWSTVAADNIDEEKYLLCKKLAEMVHTIGKFMLDKPESFAGTPDIPNFLNLLLEILRNDSLHVSIPILHLWTQLLQPSKIGNSEPVLAMIGPLLETCSQRLLRYEALPDDANVPALAFLGEDLDTVPEKHAFLGNYARFCRDVIDAVVFKRPLEALQHILGQADIVLQHLYDGEPSFSVSRFTKASIPTLKLDAHFSVIEAALSGYTHWRAERYKQRHPAALNREIETINTILEEWCRRLFEMRFEEPGVQQRILVLVTEFALDPLKRRPAFVLAAFSYLLAAKKRLLLSPLAPEAPQYNETIKELNRFISHQMQRIALRAASVLMEAFSEIEESMSELCSMPQIEDDDRDRCISVLFAIVQRAPNLSKEDRSSRLESYVGQTITRWHDPRLATSLESFQGFCDLLAFSGFQEYFAGKGVTQLQDWSTIDLDEEGKAFKARIDAAQRDLPLRATTTFLSISLDKTEPGSGAYLAAHAVWAKHLSAILPNALQMISLSHMFSNLSASAALSEESQVILSRILRDRFWQVGISTGSRDEFYSQVEKSKMTLEGLASAIRGSLRLTRDKSYRLLSSTSLLGDTIYRLEGLAPHMADAVFKNSAALSTHQTGVVVDMMVPIIEHCPPDARDVFLTPLITAMFDSLDQKVSLEWSAIDSRNQAATEEDNLQEEMKNESILRQLTYNCVMLVVRLLDPKDTPSGSKDHGRQHSKLEATAQAQPLLRDFVLSNPQVFKSVVLFCAHALQMHDNRCCGLITRVLRSIVSEFSGSDPTSSEIREFISSEVFKACIVSLNDDYFVDIQNDLAQLIATIIKRYSTMTETPNQILLSLPNMTSDKVRSAVQKIFTADGSSRTQRAIVLKLLESLRGVSISEQGKLPKPDPKKARSALQEEYMTVEATYNNPRKERSPDLVGVADMFA